MDFIIAFIVAYIINQHAMELEKDKRFRMKVVGFITAIAIYFLVGEIL